MAAATEFPPPFLLPFFPADDDTAGEALLPPLPFLPPGDGSLAVEAAAAASDALLVSRVDVLSDRVEAAGGRAILTGSGEGVREADEDDGE